MRCYRRLGCALALSLGLGPAPAAADIALDKVIVELAGDGEARADVEVQNVGAETRYVVVEAAEILAPGTPAERRETATDPEALGLLVSPSRLVLEPGARRIVRLVRLQPEAEVERIWRVGIRPVAGATSSETTALQIMVGYGVLVMARPSDALSRVVASRSGRSLALRNEGNSNALLIDGEQCAPGGGACRELPIRRLYPGNSWTVELPYDTPAQWRVLGPNGSAQQAF